MGFFLSVVELFALDRLGGGEILPQCPPLAVQLSAGFLAELFSGNEGFHEITSFPGGLYWTRTSVPIDVDDVLYPGGQINKLST